MAEGNTEFSRYIETTWPGIPATIAAKVLRVWTFELPLRAL